MEEIDQWIEQAKKDLNAADDNVQTENFQWAAFLAQQAAEKALKALYIKRYKELWKVHDLVVLSQKVDAPDKVIQACDALNPHYLVSRYPVGVEVNYTKSDALEAVKQAKMVIRWVKEEI